MNGVYLICAISRYIDIFGSVRCVAPPQAARWAVLAPRLTVSSKNTYDSSGEVSKVTLLFSRRGVGYMI